MVSPQPGENEIPVQGIEAILASLRLDMSLMYIELCEKQRSHVSREVSIFTYTTKGKQRNASRMKKQGNTAIQ